MDYPIGSWKNLGRARAERLRAPPCTKHTCMTGQRHSVPVTWLFLQIHAGNWNIQSFFPYAPMKDVDPLHEVTRGSYELSMEGRRWRLLHHSQPGKRMRVETCIPTAMCRVLHSRSSINTVRVASGPTIHSGPSCTSAGIRIQTVWNRAASKTPPTVLRRKCLGTVSVR